MTSQTTQSRFKPDLRRTWVKRELNQLKFLIASDASDSEMRDKIDDMIWRIDNA